MNQEILILNRILRLANHFKWNMVAKDTYGKLVSFKRDGERLNVYYSKMTVGTCVNHPTKGKTQLFRRNVNFNLLSKLFNDPLTHTHRGYYRK